MGEPTKQAAKPRAKTKPRGSSMQEQRDAARQEIAQLRDLAAALTEELGAVRQAVIMLRMENSKLKRLAGKTKEKPDA